MAPKKEAYADTTIEAVGKRLRHINRHCNLDNHIQTTTHRLDKD
jgi:hypothetical protein